MKHLAAPAVQLIHVTAGYGARPVLQSVSLGVQPGEAVGITGPNGAGKSTLLRVVMGTLGPQEGQVWVHGQALTSGRARRLARRQLGYVAQEQPTGELPITVFDAVLLGRWGRTFGGIRRPAQSDRQAVMDWLGWVGLADRAHDDVRNLSGGQRQRVALARALVGDPKLLILDEPTTHLDVTSQREFSGLLVQLRRDFAITTILVSHDDAILAECTDRRLTVKAGRIVADVVNSKAHEGGFGDV